LEPASVPSVNLEQFYRFALLLGGDAKTAEQVLAAALTEMQKHCGELRSTASRQAWLVGRIRQASPAPKRNGAGAVVPGLVRTEEANEAPQLLAIEAYLVARRFSSLAEPGRSALALLYLDLFSPAELTKLLGLSWEKLCEVLASAREELRANVSQMRSPELVLP
jgi:DNA-directed RNA polymerase specialized sigma24 family protein